MKQKQKKFKQKKEIQLTKNEKTLIILLALIIMFWLFNKFIFTTQRNRINGLKEKEIQYEEEKINIDGILAKESIINEDYVKLNREKDKLLLEYFPTLDQAQIIYLLNDIMDSSNLKILNLDFSEPQVEEIAGVPIKTMDVTLPYEGNYEELLDFLSKVRTSPRKFLITSLTMDNNDSHGILGQIGVKVYSLEGIFEEEGDVVSIDTIINTEKQNPFAPFDEYEEKEEGEKVIEGLEDNTDSQYASNGYSQDSGLIPKNVNNGQLLEGFEGEKTYFVPSSLNVKGSVSKAAKAKEGKYSLRVEYNILAVEEENRAYIDLREKNIILKYPPNSIGLWVHSYSYSPVTIGMRFVGQMGEKSDVEFTKGISWLGWKYVQVSPPQDISQYPLKLDKLYLELSEGRDDYGVILLDGLEGTYPENEDGSSITYNNFSFYIVKEGDTLESISKKYYGDFSKNNLIMATNYLLGNKDLRPGKILVIPR